MRNHVTFSPFSVSPSLFRLVGIALTFHKDKVKKTVLTGNCRIATWLLLAFNFSAVRDCKKAFPIWGDFQKNNENRVWTNLCFTISTDDVNDFTFYWKNAQPIRGVYIVPHTSVIPRLRNHYVTAGNPLKSAMSASLKQMHFQWRTEFFQLSILLITWTKVQYVRMEWLSVVRVSSSVNLIFLSLNNSLCPVSFNSNQSIFESCVICMIGTPIAKSTASDIKITSFFS